MTRHTLTRRSFFGLVAAAPLAVPAVLRAAPEPVTAAADVQADGFVVSAYRDWREVAAQIQAEEAATVGLRFDRIMSLCPPRPVAPLAADSTSSKEPS